MKTKGIENERERMGKMRVWLGVERGRENGAVQQFSFQAHQNLIFLGKKHEGKWGVGFLDEIAIQCSNFY